MNTNPIRFLVFLSFLFLVLACNTSSDQSTPFPFETSVVEEMASIEPPLLQPTPARAENSLPLLAFISGPYTGIYTIDEIGSTYKEAFDIPAGLNPRDLSMSPSCTDYVYTHSLGDDPDIGYQLYHFSTKNQKLTRLTDPNEVDSIQDPTWSPDGKQIAFWGVGKETHKYEIYTMNSDGDNLQRLSELQGPGCLAWSPDGTKFAYATVDDKGNSHYGIMNSDGTNTKEILSVDWMHLPPSCVSWSPDSENLLMSVYRPNEKELGFYGRDFAIVNSDGTNLRYITKRSSDPLYANSDEFEPAWSSDGKYIAYSYLQLSDNPPSQTLYIMDLEDTNRVSIGTAEFGIPIQGTSPTWCSQR